MAGRQLPVQASVSVPANDTRTYTYDGGEGPTFVNLVELVAPGTSMGDLEAYLKFVPDGEGSAFRMPRLPDDGDGDPEGDSFLSEPEIYPIPVGGVAGVSRFVMLVAIEGAVEIGLKNTTGTAEDVVARFGAANDETTALGTKPEG